MRHRTLLWILALTLFLGGALVSFSAARFLGEKSEAAREVPTECADRIGSLNSRWRQIPTEWKQFTFDATGDRVWTPSFDPGAELDLLGTFEKPDGGSPITITLLQRVEVCAAESPPRRRSLFAGRHLPVGPRRLTLLVTPEEEELLEFSLDKGIISIQPDESTHRIDTLDPPTDVPDPDLLRRYDALTIEIPDPGLIPLFD